MEEKKKLIKKKNQKGNKKNKRDNIKDKLKEKKEEELNKKKKNKKENLTDNNKENNTNKTNCLTKFRKNYYLSYFYNRNYSEDDIKKFNKVLGKIIEFIFDKFSKWVNVVGPLFVNAFLCFFFLGYHSFLYNLVPYWSSIFYNFYDNKILYYIFKMVVCPLYSLVYFQVVLYYILTSIIKPGSIQDLKRSIKYKKKKNP